LQLSERDVRSILPVANNCGNVYVRFSTFFILENVGKIKNVKNVKNVTRIKKNVKKTFFTSMVITEYIDSRAFCW